VQWYLRPAAEYTTFTLFPWAGFVFAGGAVGVLLAAAKGVRTERFLQLTLLISGASLVAFGFYTAAQPSIYRQSSFWTSSPTWFAIRVGIMMIALAVIYAAAAVAERAQFTLGPLEKLGRSSLFVYWIHVELVYGYASWFWRGRLPLWGSLVAFALFATLMYGAVLLRDHLVHTRRWRGPLRSATEVASA
jgi:fucose 4-O-acetylase-like acetyltransferase